MTGHELAQKLLTLPDHEIAHGLLGVTHHISVIDDIKTGTYPTPSWGDNPGTPNPVIILTSAEESLNETEELTLDDKATEE